MEGGGVGLASCTPSRANGAPQVFPRVPRAVKGKGGAGGGVPSRGWRGQVARGGARDDGERGRHAVHPPSVRMRKGRTEVACPRVPICHANGAARAGRSRVKGRGVACGAPLFCANAKGLGRGWRALAYEGAQSRDGPVATGKGGGVPLGRERSGVACPCVPLYAAEGARGEGVASPLPREWGRTAAGCPRANGKGGAGKRGRGRWRGAFMRTPSVRMGGADRGRVGGEGEGRRDVGEGCALVRSLSARTGWHGLGDKEGAACPRALPLSMREGVADSAGGGRGGGDGRDDALCTPDSVRIGWHAIGRRPTHVSSPPSLSSPPNPLIRAKRGRRPKSLHRAQRGAHQDKGRTMPAAPRPPGPSLLPVRATTFAWKEGARGHATTATSPVRGTPFARKGGARGLAPCPSSSYLAAPVRAGKGARDPPALPFPSRGRGAYGSTPPHHPASAPALPSCPRNPVRADRGRARPDRPTSPRRPRPRPVPLVRATPFARSEGVRGHTAPPLRVAPALFPFPLRATLFARKGGARHRPTLCVAPAPFPSLFAPRARASRPDLWRPVRAGRGARGQADPASLRVAQRGWTVSVRPRSPRPHRIFARHSTTYTM
ncbi:hypothetical protein EDB85DRAFT_1892100 [Lactarius pseudohatsudake]|nr:hypothetical protein EDB85DRAFT_1892100 [Lactarius pseudohatsudake]